ncbi:MAG: TetR/AcrR family transcriptional regulator [Rhodobacteraceae bacterium]|nr:TetR/AcrR family transcriptional regulator [Paracoccaceae bacterium]
MCSTRYKRGKIIHAAVAEFRESGFAGASMDRIAARACVSKRTVYNHFESKETLFRAILDELVDRVDGAMDLTYDPAQPPCPQFLSLAQAEGRLLTSPEFMTLATMVVSETIRDPALAAEFNKKTEHLDTFRSFIAAAAEAGHLRVEDAPTAATQFLGLLKAQAFWPVVFSGELVSEARMEEIAANTVEMFMARYGVAEMD